MAITFFRLLSDIEKDIENKGVWTRTSFYNLVAFVESGVITKSSVNKYICANWRLSAKEIAEKWNSEQVETKTRDAWRSQVSVLSREFFVLFPQVSKAFLDNNTEAIKEINETVAILQDGDVFYRDVFIVELANESINYSGQKYSVDDCEDEIRLLQKMTKSYIYDEIACINSSKLGYLHKVLQTPLVSSRYKPNIEKIKLLKELHQYNENNEVCVQSDQIENDDNSMDEVEKAISTLLSVCLKKVEEGDVGVKIEVDKMNYNCIRQIYNVLTYFTKILSAVSDVQFWASWKLCEAKEQEQNKN